MRSALFLLCPALIVMMAGCVLGRSSLGPNKNNADTDLSRAECDEACRRQAQPAECVGTADYFRDYAWPEVFATCVSCHKAGGQSDGTLFVLKTDAVPNYLALNQAMVAELADRTQDGLPLLVVKATASVPHGGGEQLLAGSRALAVLEETLERVKNPVACPDDAPPPRPVSEGVTLLDDYQTLRKASLQLVGRPPNAAEVAAVDSGGLGALDAILMQQMTEPAFLERVREIYGDVLLTDGFRANNVYNVGAPIIVDDVLYPSGSIAYPASQPDWDWYNWDNQEGILLSEALAREPLEFFVRAVRDDQPVSQVLTAKHRLLNAYSARFFNVPYKMYAAGTDPTTIPGADEFVEVAHVPNINESGGQGEYAGVLTTSAFLARYPTSPTNFNRKRARFVYKYFLDFDIMKSAPRIDAATVNLEDEPTRRNPQCTGCHVRIDPLAGAFMNQDECGYVDANFYRPANGHKEGPCVNAEGWVPADQMFPPGVGPAAGDVLSAQDRPKALEKLAEHIVKQDSFARSMATHLFVGLMSRPLLFAPTDPTVPGFAALDQAYEAEQAELDHLTAVLKAAELKLKPVVIAIIKSNHFRAGQADTANRAELAGHGGGSLTNVEIFDRKITAVTGVRWRPHLRTSREVIGVYDGTDDAILQSRQMYKNLYGGTDSSADGVKVRQRLPSTLTAAVVEKMALQVSCEAVTRDFDKSIATRKLFPKVNHTLAPNGDRLDPAQAPILQNLQYLHEWVLGERLALDDPELIASYNLLSEARAALAAEAPGADLGRPCANNMDTVTGAPVAGGTTTDPNYIIRAWQTVVAGMLMDFAFVFES